MPYTIISQNAAATRGSDEFTYYKVAVDSKRRMFLKMPKDSNQTAIDAAVDVALTSETEAADKEKKIQEATDKAVAEALLPDEAKE